jgi:capsular polysaccharide biosynthesis protein
MTLPAQQQRWLPPIPPGPRQLTAAQSARIAAIAVVVTVAGALLGLVIASFSPTLYLARTDIEYDLHRENASYFLRTDRNLSTQTFLVTDRSVIGSVAAANNVPVDELNKDVEAYIVDNTEIIRIDVKYPVRETAVKLADDLAQAYLEKAKTVGPEVKVQQELDEARSRLSTATGPAAAAAQSRVDLLQGQLDIARITSNSPRVVARAYSLASPVSPDRANGVRWGLLLGAALAGVLIPVLSRRWTRR